MVAIGSRTQRTFDKKRILVVDRPRFGQVISDMLSETYVPDVATDTLTAVDRLRQTPPHAIIADIDVPGDGLRLTELVGLSPKYNDIPVILTAAKPSEEGVVKARNAGAQSYLAKPFGQEVLQERVHSVLTSGAIATKDDIEASVIQRVREIEGLPTLPSTYVDITSLSRQGASCDEIAERIQLDPGLLATVFKLANSTCFGFRNRIDSLKLAVTLLGLQEIANLVASIQVIEGLGKSDSGTSFDASEFWRHSVGTAFVARSLAKLLQMESESAYLAGMLHDIGQIVLGQYFGYYYKPVLEKVGDDRRTIARHESDVLGLTHSDVGGHLAGEWKLPEAVQDAILFHHEPWRTCRYQRMVCLIHLADVLCHRLSVEEKQEDLVSEIDESVVKRFALGGRFLDGIIQTARQDLEKADAFLSELGA